MRYLIAMEAQYTINAARMDQVLRRRRINLRWNELWEEYTNYQPPHTPRMFTRMTMEDILLMASVFRFTKPSIQEMRKELSVYVKNFPEFCGDSLDEVLRKMRYTLKKYNAENGTAFPFVNWLPQHGGLILQNDPHEQVSFMQEHNIPCVVTGLLPVHKGNKS